MYLTIFTSGLVWVLADRSCIRSGTISLIGSGVSSPLQSFGCVSERFENHLAIFNHVGGSAQIDYRLHSHRYSSRIRSFAPADQTPDPKQHSFPSLVLPGVVIALITDGDCPGCGPLKLYCSST